MNKISKAEPPSAERFNAAPATTRITKPDGRVWIVKGGEIVKTIFPDGDEVEGRA